YVFFYHNLPPTNTFSLSLHDALPIYANINLVKKLYTDKGTFIQFDASVFYTYFENKIIADYNTDPNKIIYDNLDGYAVSKGISLDRKSTRLNSSHVKISYAVFCLKKK